MAPLTASRSLFRDLAGAIEVTSENEKGERGDTLEYRGGPDIGNGDDFTAVHRPRYLILGDTLCHQRDR